MKHFNRELLLNEETIVLKAKEENSSLKIFIQEDDKGIQKKILEELQDRNNSVTFFSKLDSIFDLLVFHPDILIQDYQTHKIIKCYEWNHLY